MKLPTFKSERRQRKEPRVLRAITNAKIVTAKNGRRIVKIYRSGERLEGSFDY